MTHFFARRFIPRCGLALCCLTATAVQAGADDLAGVVTRGGKPAANVVVWLDAPVSASAAAPRPTVVLDQRNLQFAPHVLAVPVGTPVEMPNSDRVFHNVFSFHDGKVFDLGLYPVGSTRTVVFDRPGLSRIFCNIHPNMAAYVLTVPSPLVAVTDAEGRFTIPGVAAGAHVYHVWRAGAAAVDGTVTAGAGSPVTLRLP
ncbi:MAG: methylamine utilization protein [Acidobacteria bacterium]|nr:methylamine utilization protein [Acidobacteriota bacterium]